MQNNEYQTLQKQIDYLLLEQKKFLQDSEKKLEKRLEESREIIKKLKTTSDCDWILHILTEKTMVGTLSASFHEFQAASQNPNINRKIFDLIFIKTNMACKKHLLMNKGIAFEWRCEVLKEFEGF